MRPFFSRFNGLRTSWTKIFDKTNQGKQECPVSGFTNRCERLSPPRDKKTISLLRDNQEKQLENVESHYYKPSTD